MYGSTQSQPVCVGGHPIASDGNSVTRTHCFQTEHTTVTTALTSIRVICKAELTVDKNTRPTVEEYGNPIPVRSMQIYLARIVIGALLVMFVVLQFSGSPTIESVTQGESTVHASSASFGWTFGVLSVMTGIAAFVYGLQPGIFRLYAVVLLAITGGLVYAALFLDTSNHHVTVTPTSVTWEVGTKSNPSRQQIDFKKTAYLYIDEVSGPHGPNYGLVANAATDGRETRVPIFDLMKSALPQIIENASNNNVVIGETIDGLAIPTALRIDAEK